MSYEKTGLMQWKAPQYLAGSDWGTSAWLGMDRGKTELQNKTIDLLHHYQVRLHSTPVNLTTNSPQCFYGI